MSLSYSLGEAVAVAMVNDSTLFREAMGEVQAPGIEQSSDIQRHIVAPALLEILGPVKGKQILDLYCGTGYLSRRLASLGAQVNGVDTSERLIELGKDVNSREHVNINYSLADPSNLHEFKDSLFDDIVCDMGLMMTRDLSGTVAEMARLVKLGGRFIFSVLHPCFCMPDACWATGDDGKTLYRIVDRYFSEGWCTSDIVSDARSGRGKVKHRTLARYVNALGARGFSVRRILEPKPNADTVMFKPYMEVYNRVPVAMVIEAIFPYF